MKKMLSLGMFCVLVLGILGLYVSPHFTKNTYKATVTEKHVKRSDESDKYLVFVELSNGKVRVFENTDSLLEGKWDSSDMYAKIKVGKEYMFDVYGWRIKFLSMYENIKEITEVK